MISPARRPYSISSISSLYSHSSHPILVILIFMQVAVLMNNAGVGNKGTSWHGIDNWRKVFDVNLFGCVLYLPNLCRALCVQRQSNYGTLIDFLVSLCTCAHGYAES
jgi:NAD(P)-dependent dehydrogenase (short-subunit alcohol dehydrogenase family)